MKLLAVEGMRLLGVNKTHHRSHIQKTRCIQDCYTNSNSKIKSVGDHRLLFFHSTGLLVQTKKYSVTLRLPPPWILKSGEMESSGQILILCGPTSSPCRGLRPSTEDFCCPSGKKNV